MGCYPSKTSKEVIISENEKNLLLYKHSITNIKEVLAFLPFKSPEILYKRLFLFLISKRK